MSHQNENGPKQPPAASSHDVDLVYMAAINLLNIGGKRAVVEPAREYVGMLKQSVEVPYQDGTMKIWRFREPDADHPMKIDETVIDVPTDTPLTIEVFDKNKKRVMDYIIEDGRGDQEEDGMSAGAEAYNMDMEPASYPANLMPKYLAKTLLVHMTQEIPAKLVAHQN